MAGSFRWLTRLFQSLSEDDKSLAEGVANITGRAPRNLDLFKLAVRHSSYNSGANGEHNERLEFLGDAVLGAIVAEYLFKKFPKRDEGFMTEIRSRLVNGESLGKLATKIGLDQLIQYEGRRKQPHTHRSMNGDAMEALIGAFYLDTDFNTCRAFIIDRLLKPHYDLDEVVESDHNHKSRMIEWAQKNGHKLSFEIGAEGGRGNKDFVAQVVLDGKVFATGSGFSKKKAEQAAAQNAINKIKERNRPAENEPERKLNPPPNRRPDRPIDSREARSEKQARLAPRRDGERPSPENREQEQRRENQRPIPERREGEESRTNSPSPAPQNRPQRPGRINQEELYNEASPLAQAPSPTGGNIEPTLPRPERGARPQRRERPPKRDRDSNPIRDIAGNAASADPSTWTLDEGNDVSTTHEEKTSGYLEPATFPEARIKFEEPRLSDRETTFASTYPEPAQPEPQDTATDFVVNTVRIQPKAVEVAVSLPTIGAQGGNKKKWQNVSKAAGEESQEDNSTSLAQQAFDSIASEADAFFAQTPEKPSGEEDQRATEA